MRKDVRTVLGLTLFLAAFTAACDNNPLKDDRDKGVVMYTNPSFSNLQVGGTVKVRANVWNKYSAPTGDAVTATPCNSRITAVKDTSLTEFEVPDRFVVTAVSVGSSCLVVSGGGVTDTVGIMIGPGSVDLVLDTVLLSGVTIPFNAVFKSTTGTPITGLDLSNLTFVGRDTTKFVVDTVAHTITTRSPGSAYLVTTLKSGLGPVVRDSTPLTISAAPFPGVVAPATLPRGGVATLTAGAVPFDANTTVTLNGTAVTKISQTATTYQFVVPILASTINTATLLITNVGPGEVAYTKDVPVGPTEVFSGTISAASFETGTLVTLAGGTTPFDADTKVSVNGTDALILSQTAGQIQFIVPPTTGSNAVVNLSNLGPNQVISTFTVPYASTVATEAQEPDQSLATARAGAIGGTYAGTVSSGDPNDLVKLVLPATTTVNLNLAFTGASADLDILILSAAGADTGRYNCASSANPESCSYSLPAGTYYIDVNFYDGAGAAVYRLTIK